MQQNDQTRYDDVIRDLRNNQPRYNAITNASYKKEWTLEALSGSMIELSGDFQSGRTTLAARLTLDAQERYEAVAWIVQQGALFFPPDMVSAGIDIDALVVVRLDRLNAILKAVDQLLRSKAFGLIIVTFGKQSFMSNKVQARFVSMAVKSGTTILFLTTKSCMDPSLGTMISLHGNVTRKRENLGHFNCEISVQKDKRRGPGWLYEEKCISQDGLY